MAEYNRVKEENSKNMLEVLSNKKRDTTITFHQERRKVLLQIIFHTFSGWIFYKHLEDMIDLCLFLFWCVCVYLTNKCCINIQEQVSLAKVSEAALLN